MDVPQPPRVILVAGLMASGKSTVAQLLAERLPRSVHLRGDTFRTMIVNGRAEFTLPWSDEAWRQVWLRYRLAAAAIEHYLAAGFDVVYTPGSAKRRSGSRSVPDDHVLQAR
jgi:predicted kinase